MYSLAATSSSPIQGVDSMLYINVEKDGRAVRVPRVIARRGRHSCCARELACDERKSAEYVRVDFV